MKVKKAKKHKALPPVATTNRAAFAEFLRHMRQTARLTAEAMAHKLNCSKGDYITYERGSRLPTDPLTFEWAVRRVVKDIIATNRTAILEDLRQEREANEKDRKRINKENAARVKYAATAAAKAKEEAAKESANKVKK